MSANPEAPLHPWVARPSSRNRWTPNRTGDSSFSLPAIPIHSEDDPVTWSLTAHHNIWGQDPPGSDWRDSRLSSRAGADEFAELAGGDILDPARRRRVYLATRHARLPRFCHVPSIQDPT
ncbi:hypothetical protein [Streptomyces sp. NPDC050428]|uniref:hypothetical protein n=1 Tax=Streptomyces sp. NPDC050428 TaxID=3155757 RepID=UPI00343E416C